MATLLTLVSSDRVAPVTFSPHLQAPVAAADDSHAPLVNLMREVDRELASQGTLATWHQVDGMPLRLYASGACEPDSDIEQTMLQVAEEASRTSHGPAVRWAKQGSTEGADAMLTIRLSVSGGTVALTSLIPWRGHNGAYDTATDWLPTIRAFYDVWALLGCATAKVHGMTAVLDSSDVGTILVNRRGGVLMANAAAEAVISEKDGLRRAGVMLASDRLADTMRLQASIEHVVNGGATLKAPAPVISLRRKTRRPLLAVIVATGANSGAADEVAAFIHIFDPECDLAQRVAPVCSLYALSPVETRLATLLAGGATLIVAAAKLRVQEQTARSYLKQVFVKTDTKRQAELVWLMLASAVRTAPGCATSYF